MPQLKPFRGLWFNKAHPLARGLVGCWLMNENAGGKIYDLSGNKNTGTLVGDTKWVGGKFGSCLSFDGTGDYVRVAYSYNSPNATWAFWVNFGTSIAASYEYVIDNGYVSRFIYRPATSGSSWVTTVWGTNKVGPLSTSLSPNTWYFIAITYDGVIAKAYLNGTFDSSDGTYTGNLATSLNDLFIGAYSGLESSFYLSGQIDNVMIFNRALSAAEILWLYREPFAMFDRPSIGLFYAPPAGGQTILDYERNIRGVNRGIMVGVA